MSLSARFLAALAAITVVGASLPAQAQQPDQQPVITLTLGDKAPAMDVASWAKGTPVKEFKSGHVYVVEFWATWCGPCKVSIPHLTEMAKKFKDKVDFVGVSAFESPDTKPADVQKFVDDMGDKMDYNVALDGDSNTMAQTWMIAAGQGSIPTAFIVDQSGKVAWIGHPMEMEATLQKVVDGKYDIAKAKQEAEDKAKKANEAAQLQQQYAQKLGAEDYKGANEVLDKMIALIPDAKDSINATKAENMMHYDEAGSIKLIKELFKKAIKDDPISLNQLAWAIVDPDIDHKAPDNKLALQMAKRAVELTKFKDPMILDTYALTLYKNGKAKDAAEQQEKAVKLLYDDPNSDPQEIAEFKDRLEMYKKG